MSIGRGVITAVAAGWSQVWFGTKKTTPLEIIRIGIGGAMLLHYLLATPYLFMFWGDDGLMTRDTALDNIDAWTHSVFFYFDAPWQWIAFHTLFLVCLAAFTIGWRTAWVKWIVLIGQISYAYRNPLIPYGVDKILEWLLVVMCVGPIGRAISLDRVRAVRVAKKRFGLGTTLPPYASPWAGACTRLIQLQMAVLFFYSAISKLRGDEWWNGDAIWQVFSTNEYYNPFLLDIFAHQYWLVNIATYSVFLIEIAYPFLIWQRATRPYLLAGAVFLHLQFAFLMGLFYFSFAMIMGHMSFLRLEWLARLGLAWKRRMGDMEMIYDGRCGFCVRSMAWFLAFDGLGQIKVRDFRTDPSPAVSDAQMEKALYLVLPDGRALPGFEAYRYVVPRVPGLWWQIPFFYIPVLSRLVGHPIYNWVAAHRSWLSSWRIGAARSVLK